jgi:hypothetical protein
MGSGPSKMEAAQTDEEREKAELGNPAFRDWLPFLKCWRA